MNKVILIGRLTRDAEVRYGGEANDKAVARFTLAVDRRFHREGEDSADFVSCVAFGRNAEFFEKYGRKGVKFAVEGRIQTGSYTNNEGKTIYTTDVVIETQEFAESKGNNDAAGSSDVRDYSSGSSAGDGFMNIPDGIDEELPFN